jgi:hypothetical protein
MELATKRAMNLEIITFYLMLLDCKKKKSSARSTAINTITSIVITLRLIAMAYHITISC